MKLTLLILHIIVSFSLLVKSIYDSTSITLPIVKNKRSAQTHDNKRSNTKLYNKDGSEYLISVGIGTPSQHFTVSLDTGSSDLWVPSTSCPVSECPFDRFDISKSSTFQFIYQEDELSIQYGIGDMKGIYGCDTVCLSNDSLYCIPQQVFGLASSTHDLIDLTRHPLNLPNSNGIFGIGNYHEGIKYVPFMIRLVQEGLIKQALFSISMSAYHHVGWTGELTLGGIDPTKYEGDLDYTTVLSNSSHYWMVGVQRIQILYHHNDDNDNDNDNDDDNDVIFDYAFNPVQGMIIDTGTTLSYMDQRILERILSKTIEGEQQHIFFDQMLGMYIIDCQVFTHDNQQRKMEFVLKDDCRFSLPLRDLVIEQQDGVCLFGIAPWIANDNNVSSKMKEEGWILIGESILRSTYLVFDMENQRVGFAPSILHQPHPSSSSRQVVCYYSMKVIYSIILLFIHII
ncbi:aspartic peptidase domain-containing protein [Cokeromyces recurvatus]|uniref:aspartic peptidase domain-containing protein n=1 Tax=Cokeromyces recurvatus TaxID=90255 RepID=UPI00221EC375|nr:aspartic peptidase domain-containing protein [Cokeromyces recurvatus]KAI7904814.1 aspartic peptidase domain-containing protein [Cokeromyces recurvatus]